MKYNKNYGDNSIKKITKTSSWESLQIMKKLSKTLTKSSSQIIIPLSNTINLKTSRPNEEQKFEKTRSMTEIKMMNIDLNVDLTIIRNNNNKEQSYSVINEILADRNQDYKVKFENLIKLYESKIIELNKLNKVNCKKDKKIYELSHNLQKLLNYNSKLV